MANLFNPATVGSSLPGKPNPKDSLHVLNAYTNIFNAPDIQEAEKRYIDYYNKFNDAPRYSHWHDRAKQSLKSNTQGILTPEQVENLSGMSTNLPNWFTSALPEADLKKLGMTVTPKAYSVLNK